MLLGIVVVFLFSVHQVKKQNMVFEDLLIIGAFALLFALPCASMIYALVTFGVKGVWEHLKTGNFAIFGGLVFYGALIGGIPGSLIGIKVARVSVASAEKVIVPFLPIGHAIGRIGCMMAGCCYGMKYDGPFAVFYPQSVAGISPQQGYFPVQLLEGVLNILISLCLMKLANKCARKFQLLSGYLLLYGMVRFLMEFLRGDDIRGIFFALSTSQWIAAGLSLVSALYLALSFREKHLSPIKE